MSQTVPQPIDPRSPLQVPLVTPVATPQLGVYLSLILATMFLGLASIVVVTSLRPTSDNAALDATIVGFLTATMTAALAFIKGQEAVSAVGSTAQTLQQVHLSINSRFDKFAEEIRASAHAAGVKEELDRQNAAAAAAAAAPAVVPVVTLEGTVPPTVGPSA